MNSIMPPKAERFLSLVSNVIQIISGAVIVAVFVYQVARRPDGVPILLGGFSALVFIALAALAYLVYLKR